MLFNSTEFLFFFPIVLAAYLAMPKKARIPWLLLASYFFYGCWNYKYLALILFTTAVTYVVGLLLGKAKSSRGKKWILGVGIVSTFLVLVFFKYLDFLFQVAIFSDKTVDKYNLKCYCRFHFFVNQI